MATAAGSSGEASKSQVSSSSSIRRGKKRATGDTANPSPVECHSQSFETIESEVEDFSDRIKQLSHEVLLRIYVDKTISEPPTQGTEGEWSAWYCQFTDATNVVEAGPSSVRGRHSEDDQEGQKKKRRNRGKKPAEEVDKAEQSPQLIDPKNERMKIGWNRNKIITTCGFSIVNPYTDRVILHEKSLTRHKPFPSIEPSNVQGPFQFYGVERWTSAPEQLFTTILVDDGREQRVGSSREMVFLAPTCDPHTPSPVHYFETVQQRFRHMDKTTMWATKSFRTRGHLNERVGYEPWAKEILIRHKTILKQVGLYQAIDATSEHFSRDPTILRSFLNYWSSVTNSFHFPCGEMSITLWDLRMMAGLSVIGEYYQEYVPTDEELSSFRLKSPRDAYHSKACLELFAELSQFDNITKIHYDDWLIYFSQRMK